MTLFEKEVYRSVKKIPRGKVSTYKAIACAIGRSHAYRAVGNALNRNPFAPRVPCHRVVASDGHLGGYVWGVRRKRKILRSEGIMIRKGKVDLLEYQITPPCRDNLV